MIATRTNYVQYALLILTFLLLSATNWSRTAAYIWMSLIPTPRKRFQSSFTIRDVLAYVTVSLTIRAGTHSLANYRPWSRSEVKHEWYRISSLRRSTVGFTLFEHMKYKRWTSFFSNIYDEEVGVFPTKVIVFLGQRRISSKKNIPPRTRPDWPP